MTYRARACASLIALGSLLLACESTETNDPPLVEEPDIAFAQDGNTYSVALAEGATPQLIAAGVIFPSWSPDGSLLAGIREGDHPALVLMRPDGSDFHQLSAEAFTAYSKLSEPTWSPDGQELTYVERHGALQQAYLFRIDADGTDEAILKAGGWSSLKWSPDGSRFTVEFTGPINMVARDGSSEFTLAHGSGADWSPDGTTIAYSDGRIHLISPDGTNDRVLPGTAPDSSDGVPLWSPDGDRIAFVTYNTAGSFPNPVGGVMNADGSGRVRVAPGFGAASLVWSSDGTHLAFIGWESAEDGAAQRWSLYVVNADGSGLRAVAGPGRICCFEWRPR